MSPARGRLPRWAAAASLTYVGAWLAGLLATPAVPSGASAAEAHAHIVAHPVGTLVQSLLVHGAAGAALAVLAVTLSRLAAPRTTGRGPALVAGAGLTAAALPGSRSGRSSSSSWGRTPARRRVPLPSEKGSTSSTAQSSLHSRSSS